MDRFQTSCFPPKVYISYLAASYLEDVYVIRTNDQPGFNHKKPRSRSSLSLLSQIAASSPMEQYSGLW